MGRRAFWNRLVPSFSFYFPFPGSLTLRSLLLPIYS